MYNCSEKAETQCELQHIPAASVHVGIQPSTITGQLYANFVTSFITGNVVEVMCTPHDDLVCKMHETVWNYFVTV